MGSRFSASTPKYDGPSTFRAGKRLILPAKSPGGKRVCRAMIRNMQGAIALWLDPSSDGSRITLSTRMPWWVIVYLVLFVALAAAGLWDDVQDRRPAWFLTCAILSNLAVVYLFLAFWRPVLRVPLGYAALIAYFASMCWEACQAVGDLRSLRNDPALVAKQRDILAVVAAVATLVISLPAYVVAGISAIDV